MAEDPLPLQQYPRRYFSRRYPFGCEPLPSLSPKLGVDLNDRGVGQAEGDLCNRQFVSCTSSLRRSEGGL